MNQFPNKPQYREDFRTFSEMVNQHMKDKKMKQADLVRSSGLSKATISRICRNCDNKGSTYQAESFRIVMAVCVGLKVSEADKKALFYAAFPELATWEEISNAHMDIHDANLLLYERGLPLLGKDRDE